MGRCTQPIPVDIVACGWQEAAGIMYRGIYYCNRLKAAGGLLGTEVAMSAFWSIVIASGGTLNHGSPLFIRESYIKSGCPFISQESK